MAVYQKVFPFINAKAGAVMTVAGGIASWLAFEHPNQLLLLTAPPMPYVYLAVLAFGILLLFDAANEWKVRRYLFRLPMWKITPDLLAPPASWFEAWRRRAKGGLDRTDALLVGKGFRWRQEHVQMLYDLDLDEELKRKVETANDESEGDPVFHAVGAHEEHEICLPLERLPGHTGVCGTTRVGKTRVMEVLAVQQILRSDGCVIVIDPKGDLKAADSLYDACVRVGEPERFKMFSLVHTLEKINPLLRYDEPSDVANRLVRMIQPEEGQTDNFINFALGELITVCEAMDYLGVPMSIREIHRFLTLDEVKKDYLNRLKLQAAKDQSERGKKNVEGITRVIEHPSEHYKKLIITITPILEMLSTGPMEDLLCSPSPTIDFERDARDNNVLLFSLASMVNKNRAEQVARVLLEDLTSFLGRRYAYEDPGRFGNIYLHADEVGDYNSPAFVNVLNKAGGGGLKAFCYFQTEEDWVVALGSKDAALKGLSNLNNRIWLRTFSPMAINGLVKDSPAVKVIMTQETTARNPKPDDPDTLFTASVSSRTTPTEVPMLDGRVLKSLPKGQAFMFSGGAYYKVRMPLLDDPEHSFMREKGLIVEEGFGG